MGLYSVDLMVAWKVSHLVVLKGRTLVDLTAEVKVLLMADL